MEKFGVVTDDPSDKLAFEGEPECPVCQTVLRPVSQTGVLLCPNCGSKPFEKEEAP